MALPARSKAAGISYRSGPAGSGIPVICLHGIGGDDTSFADQLDALGDRQVIAWNMPGYGGSDPVAVMNFEMLAQSIIGLMDALGIAVAHLAGQSIGGMIAQEAAIRHPDRIASLVLIATVPAFGGKDERFKDEFLAARLAPLDNGGTMQALAADAIPSIMNSGVDAKIMQTAVTAMANIPAAAYRQVLATLITFNRRNDQHLLTLPCCLIAGETDSNSPARVMQKMATGLPDATFHVIEMAGHLVNTETPDAVNRIMADFFDAQMPRD